MTDSHADVAAAPGAGAAGVWRVEIVMPCWDTGKHRGEPVGWLSMNNLPDDRWAKIKWGKAKKLWRLAAFEAIVAARVPRHLPRIHLDVEIRTPINNIKDPANLELTLKPIIDALGPERIYEQKVMKTVRYGRQTVTVPTRRTVAEIGRGVIPGDDPRYLQRSETTFGRSLGRKNPIKGVVILTIRKLDALEAA